MKTDVRLMEELEINHKISGGLPVFHQETSGVGDFLVFLEDVFSGCKYKYHRPVLHVECHGCEKRGLRFVDGYLSWSLFGKKLRDINFATKNNLIVTMATCYGLNAYWESLRYDRLCPAWYVMAPQRKAKSGDLSDFFGKFYGVLSNTNNMSEADSLVREVGFVDSVYSSKFILKVLLSHFYSQSGGRRKQNKIEYFVSLMKWLSGNKEISAIRRYRDVAKSMTGLNREVFEKIVTDFLMDVGRLGCDWEDVVRFLK